MIQDEQCNYDTRTTYKKHQTIIFLERQVISKPAYQQRSVQLFTQKCRKYFFGHLGTIIPRYDAVKMGRTVARTK